MAEPTLEGLIDALRRLPGVGVKSAQRMAFHLLQHDRDGAHRLATALNDAVRRIEATTQEKMGKLTQGMPGLPGGMKLPF